MKSITIEQAKKIGILPYLEKMGHYPVKLQNGEYIFRSPFRTEKKPSFRVRERVGEKGEDLWFDFGLGGQSGGDVIRLARLMHRLADVSAALNHLAEYENLRPLQINHMTSDIPPPISNPASSSIQIMGEPRPLQHFVLLKYLREVRKIPDHLAQKYLKLIYYTHKNANPNQKYFAFGWKNQSGAYEIRGAGKQAFKSVTGKKGITLIPPHSENKDIYIFEGMLDYLSALVIKKTSNLNGLVIILNSTALVKHLVSILENREIDIVHLFMDNDTAGRDATAQIKALLPNTNIKVHTFYKGHKDVNDYLVSLTRL